MEERRKYWKYFIYLICGLMIISPYSETFTIQNDDLNGLWLKNYALNSTHLAITIIPLILLLITTPRIESKILKRILITISFLLSGFLFLFAYQSLSIPIQDFVPQWGILILIILLPIVVINSIIEWNKE